MAETKVLRDKKKQLGQFMTPIDTCNSILSSYNFSITDKVLEPSFGCGNFIIALIEKFLDLYDGTIEQKLTKILRKNIWGVEYDKKMYNLCIKNIKEKWGFMPKRHNLCKKDYLLWDSGFEFDYIIGNPPFGGTIDPLSQDLLDRKYGFREGNKIKKETYSFFMIKSIESLRSGGVLVFISSDTFMTIKTMKGLRLFLFKNGYNNITTLSNFSDETNYPMLILTHTKGDVKDHIQVNNNFIYEQNMNLTENFSWSIDSDLSKYFTGSKLSNYILCTSGMTIGKNELFLRDINNGSIVEEYDFTFYDDPITLEKELQKARNNTLSERKKEELRQIELEGKTRRNVSIVKKQQSVTISLPNSDYCYYNKSTNDRFYSKPNTVIYWKDDGDACITYKKNGNWYLHGVGGMPFFKKEGLTWQLISSNIKARYLPAGYILDSGAPIGILKDGIEKYELLFIIGWMNTELCNMLMKRVINHTKNIQSKDVERLPYPFWVSEDNKRAIIDLVKKLIKMRRDEDRLDEQMMEEIEKLFSN